MTAVINWDIPKAMWTRHLGQSLHHNKRPIVVRLREGGSDNRRQVPFYISEDEDQVQIMAVRLHSTSDVLIGCFWR